MAAANRAHVVGAAVWWVFAACTSDPGQLQDLSGGTVPEVVTQTTGYGPVEVNPPLPAHEVPPPISGGTLAVTTDGTLVVAADPDTERVWIVDVTAQSVRGEVRLRSGDQPGRVVIDPWGVAHVVLRGAGAVATIRLTAPYELRRREVCTEPRGIAYDAPADALHVACASGELVTLRATTGEPTRRLWLADDLRDVVVDGETLVVSRFRSAEILRVDAAGVVTRTTLPPFEPIDSPMRFVSSVAWRMVAIPGGGVAVVHQRSRVGAVAIESGDGGTADGGVADSGSAYGGSAMEPCSSLVHGAITLMFPDGRVQTRPIPRALPVDMALSSWGEVAFALGGEPSVVSSSVEALSATGGLKDCFFPGMSEPVPSASVAVVYALTGRVTQFSGGLVLSKGHILYFDERPSPHPGHTLFHQAVGGSSMACASCHPEATEDGIVWEFDPIGPRRTQSLRGGILDTAPFHWDGDLSSVDVLMSEVFVRRMGGSQPAAEDVAALAQWLHALPALQPPPAADAAAVERGRALFHDPVVACASCHSGPALTNNSSANVGTGAPFQVPSLLGLVYRAPFMHTGCAATLEERFGPCGGGDAHGKTSHLSDAQLAELVAYLRTL